MVSRYEYQTTIDSENKNVAIFSYFFVALRTRVVLCGYLDLLKMRGYPTTRGEEKVSYE